MCRIATSWVLLSLAGAVNLLAQPALDWRPVGNTALIWDLPSRGTGPVQRVWYSDDGSAVFVQTRSGNVLTTSDFERWTSASGVVPPADVEVPVRYSPEPRIKARAMPGAPARVYAAGYHAYRSDDGGLNWTNLTQIAGRSILGGGLFDIASSPRDTDEVVVAGDFGVWRSLDGGDSWTGLNDLLPNLPVERILQVPERDRPIRILGLNGTEWEWPQGEKGGWRLVQGNTMGMELSRRRDLSAILTAIVTATAVSGPYIYAGADDGRLWASPDRGATWRLEGRPGSAGRVVRIWADPNDSRFALAVISPGAGGRILRTANGGQFWEDLTFNLSGRVNNVVLDPATNTLYAAADNGLWMSTGGAWTLLRQGRAVDVALDQAGNQLYVALDGAGVIAALAPHRLRDPKVVSAGDLFPRPAAPGALLSVLGGRVTSARAGNSTVPVLAASDLQSQIQIPFEASGSSVALTMDVNNANVRIGLPLQPVSPAIFIDKDGNPLVLNADSGLILDASAPARAGSRLQILATGLGAVTPAWPNGLAAPLQDPPKVQAEVRVLLDRVPLEVTRATLAPGYVGFYLIEVQLPPFVNTGTAEIYIDAGGQQSNRVRIFVDN